MHGTKHTPGAGPRHGFPVSDPGADYDPDAGADDLAGPVTIGYAISRDAYLHRLSIAVANRASVAGVHPDRAAYNDCLRLIRRRALLRHFGYGLGGLRLGGDRAASAVAGRRAGRATASSKVNWNVML